MSITSHVTVGQCSCGEHHGATPPFEEATVEPGGYHYVKDGILAPRATPPSEEAPELRDSIQRELDSGWAVSEVLRRHGFRLNMPVTSDD